MFLPARLSRIPQPRAPAHLAEKCAAFLRSFQSPAGDGFKYLNMLQEIADRQRETLDVDLSDLEEHCSSDAALSSFTQDVCSNSRRYISLFAESADELMDVQLKVGPERLAITSLDVSDENSIGNWAANLSSVEPIASHGGVVDVVINNAGTTGTDGYNKWELEDMDAEEMMHVFKINTVGPLLVTQQLLKNGLIGDPAKGKGGALVGNVTSKVGSVDDNGSGKGYAYRASKAALNIVNKSMSIDLEDRNVQCLLLHPGWVRTRMTEGRGLIDADESARGLLAAMEGAFGEINGRWYDYKGDEIPW